MGIDLGGWGLVDLGSGGGVDVGGGVDLGEWGGSRGGVVWMKGVGWI